MKGHVTVVDSVYYQQHEAGDQPTVSLSKFTKMTHSDEQAYVRRMTVGETWTPIDTGWLKSCSMVVIENLPKAFAVNPTLDERAEADAKVVEVAFRVDSLPSNRWVLPPGESLRGAPMDVKSLLVRCRSGETRVMVSVFPE